MKKEMFFPPISDETQQSEQHLKLLVADKQTIEKLATVLLDLGQKGFNPRQVIRKDRQ